MAKNKSRTSPSRKIPPVVFLAAAVVLLAVAGLLVWQLLVPSRTGSEGAGLGPRLLVQSERLDLGKQPFEKPVRAEFEIQNLGDQVLFLDASAPVRALEGC